MQGMKSYTRLSQSEREQLFLLHHEGMSLREIAKRLGRVHSTISREFVQHKGDGYSPVAAHEQAVNRRGSSRRHKLDDPLLRSYVIRKLGEHWSPEQIAGRLKTTGSTITLCHETIYSTLYHDPLKHERLWEFLRRGHKKRERVYDRRTRHVRKAMIVGKTSITERPEEAQTRSRVGHWETDLMEGTKKTHYVVSATVDRKSGATILDKLSSKESQEKMDALLSRFQRIPLHVRKTMTFDNGLENVQHRRLESLRMSTYFCAPYHSWEKGTVENTIGLVREYLPKGMDLTNVSQQDLVIIGSSLNDRPRKRLGYKTPNEVLLEEAGWCVTS
jgi:transposase, IS30 family